MTTAKHQEKQVKKERKEKRDKKEQEEKKQKTLNDDTRKEGQAWQAFINQFIQVEVNETKTLSERDASPYLELLRTRGCAAFEEDDMFQKFCYDTQIYTSL